MLLYHVDISTSKEGIKTFFYCRQLPSYNIPPGKEENGKLHYRTNINYISAASKSRSRQTKNSQ
jgi:hypothetical protein